MIQHHQVSDSTTDKNILCEHTWHRYDMERIAVLLTLYERNPFTKAQLGGAFMFPLVSVIISCWTWFDKPLRICNGIALYFRYCIFTFHVVFATAGFVSSSQNIIRVGDEAGISPEKKLVISMAADILAPRVTGPCAIRKDFKYKHLLRTEKMQTCFCVFFNNSAHKMMIFWLTYITKTRPLSPHLHLLLFRTCDLFWICRLSINSLSLRDWLFSTVWISNTTWRLISWVSK